MIVAAILNVVLRLRNLTANDFWNDEIFTFNAVSQNWSAMFAALVDDRVHPPLFYILLKIWADCFAGESIFWLRFFAVACAILTVFPFVGLCRELCLTKLETATALLLAATNFYLIRYAQELRMYSLLMFFAVCSLWLFVRTIKARERTRESFAALFAVNLLLVYTHYFGWLLIGCETFYLLLESRRRFLRFALVVSGLVLCFAPWAFAVANKIAEKRGVENLGWLQPPAISDLTGFYATLNGTFAIPRITIAHLALFGTLIILASRRALAAKDSDAVKAWRILIFFSFAPVAAVFAVSLRFPVWDYRYLIIAAAPYLILVARSAAAFDSIIVRRAVVCAVAIWALAAGFYNLDKPNQRIEWRALTEQMRRAESAANAKVYVFEPWTKTPIEFYLNKSGENRFQVVQIADAGEIKDKSFWLAIRDADKTFAQSPQARWRQRNCGINSETTFPEQQQSVLLLKIVDCD